MADILIIQLGYTGFLSFCFLGFILNRASLGEFRAKAVEDQPLVTAHQPPWSRIMPVPEQLLQSIITF